MQVNQESLVEIVLDTAQERGAETKSQEKITYENNKLHKRLCRLVGQAIGDFNMIEDGDKVMVCLSGGKDSYALLDILMTLRERAPIHFDIVAVNLDQKQPNFPAEILPAYLEKLGIPYHIENQDTYSIVKRLIPEGKTTCSLCSRLRRGILYRVADELGANKIALGHHRDDILETFFLNMFFVGELKGMPIIPCDLSGSQENLQRKQIKAMLRDWEKKHPGRVESVFSSLSTVIPSHLMDRNLFGFTDLKTDGIANPLGDIAFDEEPCSTPVSVPGIIPVQPA